MARRRYTNLGMIFVLILSILISVGTIARAQDWDRFLTKEKLHPKMEGVLSELEEEHRKDAANAFEFARERNIEIEEEDKITVFILLDKEKPIDIRSLEAYGAEVIKGTEDVLKVKVPIRMLRTIGDNVQGISFIKLPDKPHPDFIQSEGVGLTGASAYHSGGYTGSGVKVAIIDTEFDGLSSAITARELPSSVIKIDCTGTACVSTTFPSEIEDEDHGTKVAEIVHDMAPGAQLYLIKIDDNLDFVDAKDYCVTNKIDIINLSLGWFNVNFYDGKCYNDNAVCTVNSAHVNGILVIKSAGNYAQRHYEATFTDSNGDKIHDTHISFTATARDSFLAYLTWDAWPATDQDYDFRLRDSLGNIIRESNTRQTGSQPPTEHIYYEIPNTGTYYLEIYKYSASANHRLEVYSPNNYLNPAVASSSLSVPADAALGLAVAAVSHSNWTSGPQESFSSRGPTNDGRIKPDMSGPDGVSTYTGGANGFYGTSAAAPHVAGAAALILQTDPTYSPSQLYYALAGAAIDMGSSGKDNIYGYGRLNLPFSDVPMIYWAYDYIMEIYKAQITTGYGDGRYGPEDNVLREQMATFIVRAIEGAPPEDYCASGSPFPDVSPTTWSCKYIKRLKELAITTGYEDGTYRPYNLVSREEMATFIVKAVEGVPPADYCDSGSPFPDVTPDMWSCKYIKRLKELRITTGYADGRYGPYDPVTRAQMAAFLARAFLGM